MDLAASNMTVDGQYQLSVGITPDTNDSYIRLEPLAEPDGQDIWIVDLDREDLANLRDAIDAILKYKE